MYEFIYSFIIRWSCWKESHACLDVSHVHRTGKVQCTLYNVDRTGTVQCTM